MIVKANDVPATKGRVQGLRGKPPKQAKPARPRIAVYGEAGVGKTWGSLQWPDAYLIDAEGGASLGHYTDILDQAGTLYLGVEDGANDFRIVLDEVLRLSTTRHDRRTLIIDSFTKLYNTAIQVELERMQSVGEKAAFGNERRSAVGMARQLVQRFDSLDMNVLLIMHEKSLWRGGEEVGRTFDGWDKLAYELNLVVQIIKQGNTRKAKVMKSRYSTFGEGELVPWTYEEFSKRLGGHDALEAAAVPVELATDEQVAVIKKLVELLRIDDADVIKVWDSCGAARWEDMTSDRIQQSIDKLQRMFEAFQKGS